MRRVPHRRAVVLGLCALPASLPAIAAERPVGAVESLHGNAFVQVQADRRALALAASVFVGELVGTAADSTLGLHLGTATRVNLGPETSLRIDRFIVAAGGVLELNRGAMVLDHDPAADKADMAVRSPFGLIAVRGTRFFAGPSNGVFGVFVFRGAVRVIGDHQWVDLAAGLGTDIARPGAEPTPPHPWAPARVQRALASAGVG